MPRLKKKDDTKELQKALVAPEVEDDDDDDELPTHIDPNDLIPSGSTHLNLACTDTPFGAYKKGRIVNSIGDSDTAKSLLGLTLIAAVANDKRFDDYLLILDDIEEALEINIKKMFGTKTKDRIDTKTYHSNTIEQWYVNQMKAIKTGRPFIYITDSFDYLDSEDSIERAKKLVSQVEKDGESDGKTGYGMEKAKMVRKIFRSLKQDFKRTESLSYIISQTSVDIRPVAHGKKVRQCGDALKFACHHEQWLSRITALKNGGVQIGNLVQAKLGKNRMTGKKRFAQFPVYDGYGVDDVTSMVNFLTEYDRIKPSGTGITCPDLFPNERFSKKDFIAMIERDCLERELQLLMKDQWDKIEESLKLDRKPRWE